MLELGQHVRAQNQFMEMVKQTPNDWVPHNELAWSLLQMGKTEQAMLHATRASDISSSNPYIMDTIGAIHLARGETKRALVLLQRAFQRAPRNADISYNLARAFTEDGQQDKARSLLQRVLKRNREFRARKKAEELFRQLGG